MDQLFDPDEGKTLRDQAIAQVDENAREDWKSAADAAIISVAVQVFQFTTDQVWERLAEDEVDEPHDRRALGPRMMEAVKAGWISPTDKFSASARPECHRNPKRVYVSRIMGRPQL